jgi:hypothetical protein
LWFSDLLDWDWNYAFVLLILRPSHLNLNYTIGFPESPPCQFTLQNLGLLLLHKNTSHFLIIKYLSIFINLYESYSSGKP